MKTTILVRTLSLTAIAGTAMLCGCTKEERNYNGGYGAWNARENQEMESREFLGDRQNESIDGGVPEDGAINL